MPAAMDLNTFLGVFIVGLGIIVLEEILGFGITRIAALAGASRTISRDIRAALRVTAAALIISNYLTWAGFSSLTTTLTVSGVTAIAVSLALQNTLSNVISGIYLLSDGLIRLNDEIAFGGTRGTVIRVALRNTWMRTLDGEIAVVSNSNLSGGPLVNYTAKGRLSRKYGFD